MQVPRILSHPHMTSSRELMQFDCHENSRSYEKFLIRTDGKERQDEEEGIFMIFYVFLLSDTCTYICY